MIAKVVKVIGHGLTNISGLSYYPLHSLTETSVFCFTHIHSACHLGANNLTCLCLDSLVLEVPGPEVGGEN